MMLLLKLQKHVLLAISENIHSYYVDHNGGTFYNTAHNFVIIVPPGAVLQGECVQI